MLFFSFLFLSCSVMIYNVCNVDRKKNASERVETLSETDFAITPRVKGKEFNKSPMYQCTTPHRDAWCFSFSCRALLFCCHRQNTSHRKTTKQQQIVIGFSFITSKKKPFPDAVFVPETIQSHISSIRRCSMCKKMTRLLKQMKTTQATCNNRMV